jgi:hypothetical protein
MIAASPDPIALIAKLKLNEALLADATFSDFPSFDLRSLLRLEPNSWHCTDPIWLILIVNRHIPNPLCQIIHIHTFSSNHFQNHNPTTIFTDGI